MYARNLKGLLIGAFVIRNFLLTEFVLTRFHRILLGFAFLLVWVLMMFILALVIVLSSNTLDKAGQVILQRTAITTDSSNMTSFSNSELGHGTSACPRSVAGHTTNSGRANDPTVKGSSPMTSLLSTPGMSTLCSKCQRNPPNKGGDNIDDALEKLRKSASGHKLQRHGRNYYSESFNDRECLSHKLPLPVDPVIKDVCRITKATRDQYQTLTSQFLSNWVKGDPPPKEYISVYMITNTALYQKWWAYKKQLRDTTKERYYYHGTKLCCNISSLRLCSNRSCGICGITQNGFDKSLIGTNISRFKRFGKAFYLAPHSSKCHDYTVGHGQYRAILRFQVFPGKKYKLKKTNVNFTLPLEYDSAYGEAGKDLNYPELMLYNSAAALPLCIFTYKKDGIRQIAR